MRQKDWINALGVWRRLGTRFHEHRVNALALLLGDDGPSETDEVRAHSRQERRDLIPVFRTRQGRLQEAGGFDRLFHLVLPFRNCGQEFLEPGCRGDFLRSTRWEGDWIVDLC